MQYYFFERFLVLFTFQVPLGPRQSSPPLFLQALRFWRPRDQLQPGFFLKSRERSLGTRLRAELRRLI